MSRLQKTLLLIGAALIFTGLAIFILYPIFSNRDTSDTLEETIDTPTPSQITPLPPNNAALDQVDDVVLEPLTGDTMPTDEASTRSEIEQLTRFFVERFGTYSNFNYDFTTSIETFMTSSMQAYADTIVQELLAGDQGRPITDYYGVTTRILNAKVQSLELNNSASLAIIVQVEVQEGINTPINFFRRDGRVDLIYQNDKWLVNGIFYN